MAFMQSMFEAYAKSQKKAGKSKKHKKGDYDSSDSSNSEQETGYGDTGFRVEKHLKLDKPLDTIYQSTEHRPIKAANEARSEAKRADEVAIETAKTGKVTAVVAVMSIFSKKRCKLRSADCGNEKPPCQKADIANFPEENSCIPRSLSQKTRKGQ